MQPRHYHLIRYAVIGLASLVVVALTSWAISERASKEALKRVAGKIQTTQIRSCERINTLRREVNERSEEITVFAAAFATFVRETRRARADSEGTSHDEHFVSVIDNEVMPAIEATDFDKIPLTDCEAAFPAYVRNRDTQVSDATAVAPSKRH